MQRLRELARLLMNVFYGIYIGLLRLAGRIDFPVPPNSNMRRTSAKTIKHYIYSSTTTGLPISTAAQMTGFRFDAGVKILDFGCGGAGQLKFMTKKHPESSYFAVDIDPSSVAWVTENYRQVVVSKNFPDQQLDFQDNTFDLAYSVSTFSHFKKTDVDFWLAEFARVLKSGGLLIATIEGRSAVPVVARELGVPACTIDETLDVDGVFFKNYAWLDNLKARGPAISSSVDISSYFPDEYGQTVMTKSYFVAAALEQGFILKGVAEAVICDRQDLFCFELS
ncbi:class I SAM-dependent methyltransferase [Gammaproteobacteria bacterium]|nr:class I SAM-dependent methyltransferase [Gammaproteobacteria bacterium]